MAMRIDVRMDVRDINRKMRAFSSEFAFATAKALTDTAKNAQSEIRNKELPRAFDLKNKWTQSGIRITPAKKDMPSASVYSRDWYLTDHEHGKIRFPFQGKYIAIPGRGLSIGKSGRITKAKRPNAVMRRPNVFIVTLRKSGLKAIVQRPRKKADAKAGKLNVLYILKPKVNIKEKLRFEETVAEVVNKRFRRNYIRALSRAIKTIR